MHGRSKSNTLTATRAQQRRLPVSRAPDRSDAPSDLHWLQRLYPPLLFLAVAAAYSVTLNGAFLFDDYENILANARIQTFSPPWGPLLDTHRPVVQLSFAFSYLLSGLSPWGYHLVNGIIHAASACLLYGLLRLTFQSKRLERVTGARAGALAFAASLLWALHPLLTSAVAYVSHRYESLMAMFFLLTFYLTARSAAAQRPLRWHLAAFVAFLAALGSKEVAVAIPPLLLLFDRTFLASGWREVWQKRKGLHAALWAVVIPAAIYALTHNVIGTAGFDQKSVTPAQYAMTQLGVIPR